MDQYHDRINVHYSSGIYNKAWCILKSKAGWDYVKAFEVSLEYLLAVNVA